MDNLKNIYNVLNPNAVPKLNLGTGSEGFYNMANPSSYNINTTVPIGKAFPAANPTMSQKFSNLFNNAKSSWSKKTGWGGKYAKAGTAIGGALSGIQALQGVTEGNDLNFQNSQLEGDILRAFSSNPDAVYNLSSDQKNMINQIRRGNYEGSQGVGMWDGIIDGLGGTLIGAGAGAAFGGIPGALVGGIGGLINSGIEGSNTGKQIEQQNLMNLYSTLMMLEQDYTNSKRR